MKNAIDVSVVVTAYNQNASIEIVLRTLQNQDFNGLYEIIICDDGSDQDTLGAIRRLSIELDISIRYVWQPRQGERRARSRNNGLRCASGRIIILLDGDIAVKRDFISSHVKRHTGGRTAVCGSRYWLFFGDLPEGSLSYAALEPLLLQEAGADFLYSEIWLQAQYANSSHPWAACWGCNFSFTRDEDIVLFDEVFTGWGGEDQEFACRLHQRHHYDFCFTPDIFGFHLDDGKRSTFTTVRPRSEEEISDYIRNLLYFCSLYPQIDMAPACIGLSQFELDPDLDIWRQAKKTGAEDTHPLLLLGTAKAWLERKLINAKAIS